MTIDYEIRVRQIVKDMQTRAVALQAESKHEDAKYLMDGVNAIVLMLDAALASEYRIAEADQDRKHAIERWKSSGDRVATAQWEARKAIEQVDAMRRELAEAQAELARLKSPRSEEQDDDGHGPGDHA